MSELLINAPTAFRGAPAGDPFEGVLDRSFDPVFERIGLRWLPWVGHAFQASHCKTIVLGESIYVYRTNDGPVAAKARIEKATSLRSRHLALALKSKENFIYVRNFERAVFLAGTPTLAQRAKLWSEVIYHNLAPVLLDKRSQRPVKADFTNGWTEFLQLVAVTGAQRCVVYGTDWTKVNALLSLLESGQVIHKKRLPMIGKSRPSRLKFQLAGDQTLDMLFIGHPSNHFSWKRWGAFMRDQNMMLPLPDAAEVPPEKTQNPVVARMVDA